MDCVRREILGWAVTRRELGEVKGFGASAGCVSSSDDVLMSLEDVEEIFRCLSIGPGTDWVHGGGKRLEVAAEKSETHHDPDSRTRIEPMNIRQATVSETCDPFNLSVV